MRSTPVLAEETLVFGRNECMDDRLGNQLVGDENAFFGCELPDQAAVSGVDTADDRRFVVGEPGKARQIAAVEPEAEQHDRKSQYGYDKGEMKQTDEPAAGGRPRFTGAAPNFPGSPQRAGPLRRFLGGNAVFRRNSDLAHEDFRPAPC